MPRFRCNSCAQEYDDPRVDGTPEWHTCYPFVLTHAVVDAQGNITTPETRTPRPSIRNENVIPGLVYIDGVAKVPALVPGERALFTYEPATVLIVSEGLGRTQIG